MRTLNTLPSGSDGKECVCHEGDLGLIPGLGRSPGEGSGYVYSSILACRIPRTEEPSGLQFMGLRCLPSVSHSSRCFIHSFTCTTGHLIHCTVCSILAL